MKFANKKDFSLPVMEKQMEAIAARGQERVQLAITAGKTHARDALVAIDSGGLQTVRTAHDASPATSSGTAVERHSEAQLSPTAAILMRKMEQELSAFQDERTLEIRSFIEQELAHAESTFRKAIEQVVVDLGDDSSETSRRLDDIAAGRGAPSHLDRMDQWGEELADIVADAYRAILDSEEAHGQINTVCGSAASAAQEGELGEEQE